MLRDDLHVARQHFILWAAYSQNKFKLHSKITQWKRGEKRPKIMQDFSIVMLDLISWKRPESVNHEILKKELFFW